LWDSIKSAKYGFMYFYIGLGMQLIGITSVGFCFFGGVRNGDYGKVELAQLLLGSFFFYVGTYFRGKK